MTALRIDWALGPDVLAGNLDAFWDRVAANLERELNEAARLMAAFARESHPWQNRTGEAEAKLASQVANEGDRFTLTVYQGAAHGVFLEKRWGGRWGVLPATITMGYPLVMKAALNALRG